MRSSRAISSGRPLRAIARKLRSLLLCVAIVVSMTPVTPAVAINPVTANAGLDQTVDSGVLVTLNGSSSVTASGTVSYLWVQTGGPW